VVDKWMRLGMEVGTVALVQAGDEVIVTKNIGRGDLRTWRARITKVARVWLELEELRQEEIPSTWHRCTWRMRRDTQQENVTDRTPGGGLYQARFWTLEQWERKVTLERARELLAGQGIRIEYTSPWSEREVELAELLRSHLEQHP
jgi:hypothetical protein